MHETGQILPDRESLHSQWQIPHLHRAVVSRRDEFHKDQLVLRVHWLLRHEDKFNCYNCRGRPDDGPLRFLCLRTRPQRPDGHLDFGARQERFCRPTRRSNRHRDDQRSAGHHYRLAQFRYEGATETFFYSDSTGSENNATNHTGKDLKSKTKWDHDVLKVTTTQSGAVTLESYTLAADGTMIVSVVRPEHKPITLVFQR